LPAEHIRKRERQRMTLSIQGDEEEGSPSQDGNTCTLTPTSLRSLPLSRLAGEGNSSETRMGERALKSKDQRKPSVLCHQPTTFPSKKDLATISRWQHHGQNAKEWLRNIKFASSK